MKIEISTLKKYIKEGNTMESTGIKNKSWGEKLKLITL